ncbi:transcriptional regulator [Candidatus Poribacteria bacterium]|nr:transcriptional regulator [Candidatus Poribacteria bacterium]
MKILDQELADTIKVWPVVSKVLSTFETEQQYNKAVGWLDELIDEVGENGTPLIESLIDTLGTLVKDYEDRNIPEPDVDPIDCLRFLMEEHNLKPSNLPEMGNQEVVSDILSGKKPLTVTQIKVLSERFNVSPAVFV